MADCDDSRILKLCTRCGAEKPATRDEFSPHKLGRYGLHPYCRPCKKTDDTERRNRPEQLARQKAWRDANKHYVKDYNKAYRDAGYSSTEDAARWRAANLEHARALARQSIRKRRAEDPAFLLKSRMGTRLRMAAIGKSGRRLEAVFGYSMETLRLHLERQFTRGMNWKRFMAGEIEIDHIVPVKAFKITSVDDPDFRVCWGLPNLQPLWARDNRVKNAKRLTLL